MIRRNRFGRVGRVLMVVLALMALLVGLSRIVGASEVGATGLEATSLATAPPSEPVANLPPAGQPAGIVTARPASWPPFVIGASYQGPAVRAWRGDYWAWWADDLFDRRLVNDDFARASAAGLNTLRIFVQLELLREIRDDKWSKLDTVLDLADQHGLRLIVTLGDYEEPRVARLASIDAAISARYAGRKTVLAYDLRNEPTFWQVQSAMYSDNQKPPLLSRTLLEEYGEQAANHYIKAFRDSDEGQRGPLAIPGRFSEDEAYVYHNNWILAYKLSLEATDWAKRTGRSDLEFYSSPEAVRWRPLLEALDTTYAAWIEPRIQAIRSADPEAVITMGHHDALMASLPTNQHLDVLSLHRYVPAGLEGLADQRRQIEALRALYPGKPVMMGEFGHRATDIGDDAAAVEETATWLQLLAHGYAGGLKWMLNDTRDGTDTMGMYRMDATPRPIAHATALIAQLALTPRLTPDMTLTLSTDDAGGTCYRFTRGDLLAMGGRCGMAEAPVELLDAARQVFAARAGDGSYLVGVTAPTRLRLRNSASVSAVPLTLTAEGAVPTTRQPSGAGLATVDLDAGRTYQLTPGS